MSNGDVKPLNVTRALQRYNVVLYQLVHNYLSTFLINSWHAVTYAHVHFVFWVVLPSIYTKTSALFRCFSDLVQIIVLLCSFPEEPNAVNQFAVFCLLNILIDFKHAELQTVLLCCLCVSAKLIRCINFQCHEHNTSKLNLSPQYWSGVKKIPWRMYETEPVLNKNGFAEQKRCF